MRVFDHERSDGCFRICPYCDAKYQVDAESYSEESRVEECDSCGKRYLLWDVFDVTHYAHRDCQSNGEKHDPDDEIPTYCRKCGMHICDGQAEMAAADAAAYESIAKWYRENTKPNFRKGGE